MKDFMTAVIAANISEDITNFATAEVAKIDGKNEKRRNTATAAQKANTETVKVIAAGMSGTVTAAEVATKYGMTVQKASALMQMGVKSGIFTAVDVKVKGKGKVKGYTITSDSAEGEGDAE